MSLVLSQLSLNGDSTRARAEVRDPYQMHRTLAKAFGEGEDAQRAARCLFRVEESEGCIVRVLVQSRDLPDWSALTITRGYFACPPAVKEIAPCVAAGQTYAFRLRANPTTAHHGKRTGLYSEEERLAWLTRKARMSGFEVGRVALRDLDAVRTRTANGQGTVLSAVQFDGLLRVVDSSAMIGALENGIGAGKGFGFGLLSLARA